MKRLISLIILLIITLCIAAQSNAVGRAIGKKVAKESTEQITKKVAKETAEEATEKIIKNVADDAASPVYKRAIRKGIANSSSKSSIIGRKGKMLNQHSEKIKRRNTNNHKYNNKKYRNATLADIRRVNAAINDIGADNIDYISKTLNITPQDFKKTARKEFIKMVTSEEHKDLDPHYAVQFIKQRIKELRDNPQLAKEIFNDKDLLINEYTLVHLFPRHGKEFAFKSFRDIISDMKLVYKNCKKTEFRELEGTIGYTWGNKTLVFKDAKPKPYVISFYTKS